MNDINYVEKTKHGTAAFPIEYYYVDETHPRYIMTAHWHREFEIIRVLSGSFTVFLNNTEFTLHEGDMLFVACGCLHRGQPTACVYECIVVDLKMLYKKTPNLPKKMYIKTLFEEGNVLKKIVRNYDDSASHYKTVSRMISDKDLYKFRLGLNLVDTAKAVLRTDRKTAADKLYDARKIFKE